MSDAAVKQTETRGSAMPVLMLTVITVACLVPFVGKAFNMDDTLFLWAAKHIQSHPLDPYGFDVNWYAYTEPMWKVTMNPPLASYYLALAGCAGWSEAVLHIAFLLPALAAVLGIYFLATRFCGRPVVAALVALLTPVFLVSSTSVMSDTMMLAFWVWAVYLWLIGLEKDKPVWLATSALLIAFCALTKYFGMSLIPLLLLYSLVKKRGIGVWAVYLLIPVAILAGYYWWTKALYGRGLLLQAASYAGATRRSHGAEFSWKLVVALVFTGGCTLSALFYAPLLWSRRVLLGGAVFVMLALALGPLVESIGRFPMHDEGGIKWLVLFQLAVMAAGGIGVLALAVGDLRKRRDADSLLLFSWVIGAFVFAGFMNWTVNGRSILPMVPAIGMLIVRRIEERSTVPDRRRWIWPLIPAALVALLVTWADSGLAGTARHAAHVIRQKYAQRPGDIWFEGHWGFQYYMEAEGGKVLDMRKSTLDFGDLVVIAANNCNIYPIPPGISKQVETISVRSPLGLSAMNRSVGAGFYSDAWGPLPFGFGSVTAEEYAVLSITGRHTAPFTAAGHRKLGREAGERGDLRRAIHHFREAVVMDPEDMDARIDLGVAYILSGNLAAGIERFAEAVELDPLYPEAHYDLGTALFQAGRIDEAILELRKVLELEPAMVPARNNLAAALIMKGRHAEARQEVRILQEHGAEVRPDILKALAQKVPG